MIIIAHLESCSGELKNDSVVYLMFSLCRYRSSETCKSTKRYSELIIFPVEFHSNSTLFGS